MAISAPHPWEEARPPPLKGALTKAFCAFFIFCTVFSHRTHNETHSQTQRKTPVIYFTTATHSVSNIQQENRTVPTFTDATTREKLPEASPKGPGPMHFRALAGQRLKQTQRTLAPQGLASRPPNRKQNQTSPKNKTYLKQIITTLPHTCITLNELLYYTQNSSHRIYTRIGGSRRTQQSGSHRFPNFPLNPYLPENNTLRFAYTTQLIYVTADTRTPTETLEKQEINSHTHGDAIGRRLKTQQQSAHCSSRIESPQTLPPILPETYESESPDSLKPLTIIISHTTNHHRNTEKITRWRIWNAVNLDGSRACSSPMPNFITEILQRQLQLFIAIKPNLPENKALRHNYSTHFQNITVNSRIITETSEIQEQNPNIPVDGIGKQRLRPRCPTAPCAPQNESHQKLTPPPPETPYAETPEPLTPLTIINFHTADNHRITNKRKGEVRGPKLPGQS